MDSKPIERTIKDIIVQRLFLPKQPEEIADDTLLMEELGVDSVSVFEIVVGLEEVYGVSFEDDAFDIQNFRTPRAIADYVRRKMGDAAVS